jgi:hypothetical protein
MERWAYSVTVAFHGATLVVDSEYENYDISLIAAAPLQNPGAAHRALDKEDVELQWDELHKKVATDKEGVKRETYSDDEGNLEWTLMYRGNRLVGVGFSAGS